MALIEPLQIYLPVNPSRTVINAYNTYSKKEREQIKKTESNSFFNLLEPNTTTGNSVSKNRAIATAYQKAIDDGVYTKFLSSYWLYQIVSKDRTYTGIVCGLPIKAIRAGRLLTHEGTFKKRIQKLGEYLLEVNYQAEPIVAAVDASEALSKFMLEISAKTCTMSFEFNKRTHRLWQIDRISNQQQLEALFADIKNCYLVDGHHRAAALQYACQFDHTPKQAKLLSYILPDDQIKVSSFYWYIEKIAATAHTDIFKALGTLSACPPKTLPNAHYPIVFRLGEQTFQIENNGDPYPLLFRLYQLLENMSPDIGYYPRKNRQNLTLAFTKKKPDFCCIYNPLDFSKIKEVANAHEQVPPKTTYLHPKLLTGQFISPL